jgi:branched-chain amino acid transport system substrate-binding protein
MKIQKMVLVLAVVAGMVFVGCSKKAETKSDVVKIGIVFPFTGGSADQGPFNRDGAYLARDEINAAGGIKSLGGAKIELVSYDNETNPDTARAVAERLVAEHKDIVAVTGAAGSNLVIPMLATFEKNEIPFLTAQTSQTITNQGYQYVFAFAAQSPQFAATQVGLLDWINAEYGVGITKVGLIYEDSEWGRTNSQAARDEIKKSSTLTLAYDQSYQASSSDVSSLIVGLKAAGCEAVFPSSYTQDAKLIFNTMIQNNYSPLIIGGGAGFLYPVFAQDLGPLVDGVLSVSSHNYDAKTIRDNREISQIGETFEKTFGYFMPEQGVSAYNALYIVKEALEANGGKTDGPSLMAAIRKLTNTTATPGGALKFGANGWNENSVAAMVQWQRDPDGKFRPHTVFPPSEKTVDFQLTDMLKSRVTK